MSPASPNRRLVGGSLLFCLSLTFGVGCHSVPDGSGSPDSTSPDSTSPDTADRSHDTGSKERGPGHAPIAPSISLSPEERAAQLAAFEAICDTIQSKHWEDAPGGKDWNELRATYRPRIEAARTEREARSIMREALGELGQSHFGIVPREIYERVDEEVDEGDGRSGITVRIVDEAPVVIRVEDPAAAAGVRPGWAIASIDERSLSDELATVGTAEGLSEGLASLMKSRRVERLLAGDPGETRHLECKDASGRSHSVEFVLTEPTGQRFRMGLMPEIRVDFEVRDLGDYGYFRLSAFMDPARIMPEYRQAIRRFADKEGLIIDLRGNPGGIGFMANGLAGHLIAEGTPTLGTMIMRESKIPFVANPQVDVYTGPLAILVDENSASTSEIFAAGLQDIDRAIIIGRKTAGAALPSVFTQLPNGDGFQYAIADFVRPSGGQIEGAGVTPDIVVQYDRKVLAKERDPFIEAAIRHFEK